MGMVRTVGGMVLIFFAIYIVFNLRILVYLVIYDSGWVSLEHLLLSRYQVRYCKILVDFFSLEFVPPGLVAVLVTQIPILILLYLLYFSPA